MANQIFHGGIDTPALNELTRAKITKLAALADAIEIDDGMVSFSGDIFAPEFITLGTWDAEDFTTTGTGTLTITGLTERGKAKCVLYRGVLPIPATLDGKSVVAIGDMAFHGVTGLVNVSIPDSVTNIGAWIFKSEDSDGLASLKVPFVGASKEDARPFGYFFGNQYPPEQNKYIPGTLKTVIVTGGEIDARAFYDCDNIVNVSLLEGVTAVGERAFGGCDGLSSVSLGNGLQTIGDSAFSGCTSLPSIVIPNSVTSIGSSILVNCPALESLTVAEGNTAYHSAGNCLIETATGLLVAACENSVVPTDGSVTSIGDYAFAYFSFTSFVVPDSVTSIGDYAFNGCSSLASITIPDGVTSIGQGAFQNCNALASITLPSGLTSLETAVLWGCSSLTSITIPDSVTSIESAAFNDCDSLEAVHITDIGKWVAINFGGEEANPLYYAGNLYLNGELVTDIVIPDSVTSITDYAFAYCTSLTSVTIPDSVTSIGISAFRKCTALASITIPFVGATKDGTSNTHFGYIFGASGYNDNRDYVPTSLDDVIITGGTSIGERAFLSCYLLRSATIPVSVTSIGLEAFWGCSSMRSFAFEGTVEQWNAVAKGRKWNSSSAISSVVCSDGTVSV